MNWILMIVLGILGLSAFVGYNKGLLRIIYSLVSWVIVLAFVTWATPHINLYILEKTVIPEKVQAYCEGIIRDSSDEQVALTQQQAEEELMEQFGSDELLAELSGVVPEVVLEGILDKAADATDEFLDSSGVYTAVAQGMASFIIEGTAFLVALVAARLVVFIISQLLGIVSHIPVIKGMNRTLGLVAGAIYGLLLVWLGFYITALGSASEMGQVVISYIYANPFLTFLYENNVVLTMIMRIF